jgi:hypothetical protein
VSTGFFADFYAGHQLIVVAMGQARRRCTEFLVSPTAGTRDVAETREKAAAPDHASAEIDRN